MSRLVSALNYEFNRLGLPVVAWGPARSKVTTVMARGGHTKVPAYRALLCVAGIGTDAPYQDKENALTTLLALAR